MEETQHPMKDKIMTDYIVLTIVGDVTEQIHLQEVPLFGFCWNVDVLFDKWLAL